MIKKLICAALCMSLLTISCGAEWSGFRTAENSIIGKEYAVKSSETQLKLSVSFDEGVSLGSPAVKSGSIYIAADNKLQKLYEESGELTAEYTSDVSFINVYPPAVVAGTVAGASENGVVALNSEDMSLKWRFDTDGYAVCTPITLKDDIAFFGADKDGAGAYFAVKNGEELWRFESEKSFADCGAVISKERVVFGGADGSVISHSLEKDEFASLDLGGAVASTPFADEYAVYMTTDNGYVHKFRLKDDGSFEDGTLTSCFIDETKLSSPLVNMGRLYVSADGKPFAVLDSLNMEIAYRIDEISSSTAPIITVANGARVLVMSDSAPHYVYSVYDYEAIAAPSYVKLAQFDEYDGSMKALVMSKDGVLYVKVAANTLAGLSYKGLDYLVIGIKLLLVLALFILFVVWIRVLSKKSRDKKSPFIRS